MRYHIAVVAILSLLAACAPPAPTVEGPTALGPDGLPLPTVYRIRASDEDDIKFRMLDSINALRRAAAAPELQMNSRLTAAAATHARDMSGMNRPWHFGSDGSSPIDRVARTGYPGPLIGEAISETYETETQTLAAWMNDPAVRSVILDKRARNMGFDWYQERSGKLWWTLVLGG